LEKYTGAEYEIIEQYGSFEGYKYYGTTRYRIVREPDSTHDLNITRMGFCCGILLNICAALVYAALAIYYEVIDNEMWWGLLCISIALLLLSVVVMSCEKKPKQSDAEMPLIAK
jgi:hypothetical protein